MKHRILIASFIISCLCGCGSNKVCTEETGYIETENHKSIGVTESDTVVETEIFVETMEESTTDSEEIEETETSGYSEEDLYILSRLIYRESGGCSWKQQLYTGSVVLNRVKSERYPDTIKDVAFQRGQYSCTRGKKFYNEPSETSVEAAKYLLENGSQIPKYVLYQAEFKQGDGVWLKMGNTYFCYEKKDKQKGN